MDQQDNFLGSYLKERRARLDPKAYGLPLERRRTPGLRREEVAQLAHVSATWYTWLEQGRGGTPSADVLDRLSRALSLSEEEREHLYLLAHERPPKVRRPEQSGVSPQLQRLLDAFADTPAMVKTPDWTVIAWNAAAGATFVNYEELATTERNVLRMMFSEAGRARNRNWEDVARLVVSTVRRDVLRAGMREETRALIEDLSRESEAFRGMWAEQDVRAHGEGLKRLIHPVVGSLDLEFSTFDVDGRADLSLVVFNPATSDDRAKIRRLMAG